MSHPFLATLLAVLAATPLLGAAAGPPVDPPPPAPRLESPPAPIDRPTAPAKLAPKPKATVSEERPARDPTLPGPSLRSLISKPAAAGPVAIPVVELKGRILAGLRTPMVTLAVGAQLHMVPEGSRISLPGAGEIQVSKISAEEVLLEILPQRYTVTLH